MKRIYWEPWLLTDKERQQFEAEYWNKDVQLVTDLETARKVTQGYRDLYNPDMAVDELRVIDKKVRVVAQYARDVDEKGIWRGCEEAKDLAAEIHQRFMDMAEAKEVKISEPVREALCQAEKL